MDEPASLDLDELPAESEAAQQTHGAPETGRGHVLGPWVLGVFIPEEIDNVSERAGFETDAPSLDERLEMLVERVSGWLETESYEAYDALLERIRTDFSEEVRKEEHADVLLSTLAEATTEEHGANPDDFDEREEFLETFNDVIVEREALPGKARALLTAYAIHPSSLSSSERKERVKRLRERGEMMREKILEEKTYLDAEETAARLETSVDDVIDMVERNELIGFRRDQTWRIPDFQFDGGAPLPELERVLEELKLASELEILTFFLGTYHRLGGRSIVEGLAEGEFETVLSIARTRGEQVAR